ncbi:MAG: proline--tRNA ligase [Polyangiaceae bacterium]
MRFSGSLIRTLKEAPADAVGASHVLLSRGGYIRRVGAGIYNFLPLGLRVLRKIEAIVRAEMDRSGALEVLMPALLPAEYFQETGRWDRFGDTLLRLKDRKGGDYHLGPTHEEIVTDLVRREVKSYRDLPMNLYQIQTKFRDEARPRAGLLRCREFVMKDAYSFDVDEAGARASYEKMRLAYNAIFTRLQLDYRMVAADSGAMGGNTSAEFQVLTQSGEDAIAVSDGSDYAANLEVAASLDPTKQPRDAVELLALEKVATPGKRTIDEVAAFFSVGRDRFLKSLVYTTDRSEVILAIVRGDHEVNEIKLARAAGAGAVFMATDVDVKKSTGADVGYAGPVGFKGRVLIDRDASVVANAIAGANDTGFHIKNVNLGRDFTAEIVDLRNVVDGDVSPDGKGKLKVYRGIEAGHIFILGTHYTEKMGARYLGEDGHEHPIVMGCYGIGVSRLAAAAVEQHHDDAGILWPMPIAPYHVHIVTLGKEPEVAQAASELEQALSSQGIEVLWDDRNESAGVKFKDADLLGIPLRITIGAKGLKAGIVELKKRADRDPKSFESIPVAEAATRVAARVQEALQG